MEGNYIAPAPWTLHGNGLVLLYRFPQDFIEQHGFLLDYQRQGFKAGIGAVMLMDYKSSGVGPYREILFIPGLLQHKGKLSFTISRIYVSTYDSVRSGKRNWGIPKELADFEVSKLADGACLWKVKKEGITFFEAAVKPKDFNFPFTTKPIPITRILQESRYGKLLTNPEASGKATLASLQKVYANREEFPPVQEMEPLICLTLQKFRMKFPVAIQLR